MMARAPGKLMLAGEYAVLHGHPALVMAVDRHAVATVSEGAVHQPPEVVATLAVARREGYLQDEHKDLAVDCTPLAGPSRTKLGLGSSAAGCVAALALARAIEGREVDDRQALGNVARRGHREAQGGGSGVDVLAAAMGGVLRVTLGDTREAEPTVLQRTWPAAWPWAVLWTGNSVRTSEMLATVDAMAARDPRGAQACWAGIAVATQQLDTAMVTGDLRTAVAAVTAHGHWMQELGERAGVAVVTESLAGLRTLVEASGVGVKPSGAGGGDVALMLGPDTQTLAAALAVATRLGFAVLPLSVDVLGVDLPSRSPGSP